MIDIYAVTVATSMMLAPSRLSAVRVLRHFVARSSQTQSTVQHNPEAEDGSESSHEERVLRESLEHPDFFGVRDLVTLKGLYEARVHWGHKQGTRNDFMKPYLFGSRLGVDIIDLDQTLPLLQDALNVTAHVAFRGGIILLVSRHRPTIPAVEDAARSAGEYSHCRYWQGGTMTNARTVFGAVTRLPDLCIFLNTLTSVAEPHVAVVEAAKALIPTVGVLDSNCDPRLVAYPVPGNDDSPEAVGLYCSLFARAILAGKEKRKDLLLPKD